MREVFAMWRNTRMVVLTAVSASLYASILIPFKVLPVIPGVTELRPANAIPVICSFLFGPAGAWGAAIGNLIGDFFGGIGPGDLFGFVGNFLYGLIPYKLWRTITSSDPTPHSPASWIALGAVIGVASAACALTVGWGLNLLGFVPFRVLGNIVLLNNFVVAAILAPLLLLALYPRVKRARLRHCDVLEAPVPLPAPLRWLAVLVLVGATAGGFVFANLVSAGRLAVPGLGVVGAGSGALEIGVGLLPFVLVVLIAALVL